MKIALIPLLIWSCSLFAYPEHRTVLFNIPSSEYKTENGRRVVIEAQIGLEEKDVQKGEVFAQKLKQAIEKAVAAQGSDSLKTKEGKFLLKGRVLFQLSEAGISAYEVNWTSFLFAF